MNPSDVETPTRGQPPGSTLVDGVEPSLPLGSSICSQEVSWKRLMNVANLNSSPDVCIEQLQ